MQTFTYELTDEQWAAVSAYATILQREPTSLLEQAVGNVVSQAVAAQDTDLTAKALVVVQAMDVATKHKLIEGKLNG